MTQNAPYQDVQLSQSDTQAAEQTEQAALNAAQSLYLNRRVVFLRAQLTAAQTRVAELERELELSRLAVPDPED